MMSIQPPALCLRFFYAVEMKTVESRLQNMKHSLHASLLPVRTFLNRRVVVSSSAERGLITQPDEGSIIDLLYHTPLICYTNSRQLHSTATGQNTPPPSALVSTYAPRFFPPLSLT